MLESIVRVHCDGNNSFGTGFIFKSDDEFYYIATCGHVINDLKGNIFIDNIPSDVILNKYKDGIDISILRMDSTIAPRYKPLPLKLDGSLIDSKVIGFSLLGDRIKKESISVRQIKKVELEKDGMKLSSLKLYPNESIKSGYSGAPLLDTNNSVLGIINIRCGDDTNYALSISHLDEIYECQLTSNQILHHTYKQKTIEISDINRALIKEKLSADLFSTLHCYSNRYDVWVDPNIYSINETLITKQSDTARIACDYIINNRINYIISARPQYGLTSLAYHLSLECWCKLQPELYLYLDASLLKPYEQEIILYVNSKLTQLKLTKDDVSCIILDNVSCKNNRSNDIISRICELYDDIPLIIMFTNEDSYGYPSNITLPENRDFEQLYLWPLTRGGIRNVVSKYNNSRFIGEEDLVINKVTSDLETLNIPRTPLNCLTILKTYEVDFEESPINRTEIIRRVLSILFNTDSVPSYKTKPDIKDVEYVLGYYCEHLLKQEITFFDRKNFLHEISTFCTEHEIDLDIDIIFDVLYQNSIIIKGELGFRFRFTYWIIYFAAQRMHQSEDFMNYVFNEMNYLSYPEIVEFYTGIDRRRDNALNIIRNDISFLRETVSKECGIPDNINIYDFAQWKPSAEAIEVISKEISDSISTSNLPCEIKDQYADKYYDYGKPLNQNIDILLEQYHLTKLMRSINAGSKALRNSDYTSPDVRHALLREILLSWRQLVNVLVALSPVMAHDGHATIGGTMFNLDDSIRNKDIKDRFSIILNVLPMNVVSWYKDDLFSKKMSSLLYKHIDNEENCLTRHNIHLLILNKKPKGWEDKLYSYITSVHKNSYYLFDLYRALRSDYKYSFSSREDLNKIEYLLKATLVKHQKGIKAPGPKAIGKLSNQVLPERDNA